MVFEEGVTIVIHTMGKDTFWEKYNGGLKYENAWNGDTYQKILDKDSILPRIERLEEKQTFFAQKPMDAEFMNICNEFWWVLKTFAEYTLREELPAAMFYLNVAVRDLLNKMLHWYLYLQAGQPVELGILDSNLEKLLDKDLFILYKQTYPTAECESIWQAYDALLKLWREAGDTVANKCGFCYPKETDKNMTGFIQILRKQKS